MSTTKSYVGMRTCYLCGEVKDLVLDRRMRDTFVREACYDKEPCDQCKEHMKNGIILISVRNGESGENPYRTGGWIVIKEEAVKRFIVDKTILKHRVAFLEDEAWDKVGLPRGGDSERESTC